MIEAMSLPELWQDLVAEVVEYARADTVMVLQILPAAAHQSARSHGRADAKGNRWTRRSSGRRRSA
jgi:hypothetical protein